MRQSCNSTIALSTSGIVNSLAKSIDILRVSAQWLFQTVAAKLINPIYHFGRTLQSMVTMKV
jgi:hypothetical protein